MSRLPTPCVLVMLLQLLLLTGSTVVTAVASETTAALLLLTPSASSSIWYFTSTSSSHYTSYAPSTSYAIAQPPPPPPPAQHYPPDFQVASLVREKGQYIDLNQPQRDGGSGELTTVGSTAWSLSMWIYIDSLSTSNSQPQVLLSISASKFFTPNNSLLITILPDGSPALSYFNTTLPTSYAGWTSTPLSGQYSKSSVLFKQWMHLGLVWNTVGQSFYFYLGGKLISSRNLAGMGGSLSGLLTQKMKYCTIGRSDMSLYTSNMLSFQGLVFAAAWFDYALVPQDIYSLAYPQTASSVLASTPYSYTQLVSAIGINNENPFTTTLSPWKYFKSLKISTLQSVQLSQQIPSLTTRTIFGTSYSMSFSFQLNTFPPIAAPLLTFQDTLSTPNIFQLYFLSTGTLNIRYGPTTGYLLDTPLITASGTGNWTTPAPYSYNVSQTQWNILSVTYDSTTRKLISYVNDYVALNFTPPVATPPASVYSASFFGPGSADLSVGLAGFSFWQGQVLSYKEVIALMPRFLIEYTHDAPKTVVAGTTLVVTFTVTATNSNTSLVIRGGVGASSVYQRYDFTRAAPSILPVSFLIPNIESTSTYTITFEVGGWSNPNQILPQTICIEIIEPSTAVISADSGLTQNNILTTSQLLQTSDWSLPLTPPFTGGSKGCYTEDGPSGVPGAKILTCTDVPTSQNLDLMNVSETKVGMKWPGINSNPSEFTFAWWFRSAILQGDDTFGGIFHATDSHTSFNYLQIRSASTWFNFAFASGGSVQQNMLVFVNDNKWHHLVLECSIRGCLFILDAKPDILYPWPDAWTMPTMNFDIATFGGYLPGGLSEGLKGSIASFHFWNRALSGQEIALLASTKPVALQIPSVRGVRRVGFVGKPASSQLLKKDAAYLSNFNSHPPFLTHGVLLPAPSNAPAAYVLSLDATQVTFDLLDTADVPVQFPSDMLVTKTDSSTFSIWCTYDQTNDPVLFRMSNPSGGSNIELRPTGFRITTGGLVSCTAVLLNGQQPVDLGQNVLVHLVAKWDAGLNTCEYYINGRRVASSNSTLPQTGFIPSIANIGGDLSVSTRHLKGTVAQFAYWRRSLNGEEIAALARDVPGSMLLPVSVSSISPAGRLILAEQRTDVSSLPPLPSQVLTAAQTILLTSDYNFLPTRAYSSVVPSSLADPNQPLEYGVLTYTGASTSYTSLSDVTQSQTGLSYNFPQLTTGSITISVWMLIANHTVNSPSSIFSASSNGASLITLSLSGTSEGEVSWVIQDTNSSTLCLLTPFTGELALTPLDLNKWHHLVGMYDQSAGMCSMYWNGNLISSSLGFSNIQTGYFSMLPSVPRTDVYLGKNSALDSTNMFVGSIAQFTMWQRALDSTEVAVLAAEPPSSIARLINPQLPPALLDISTPPQPTAAWNFLASSNHYHLLPTEGAVLTAASQDYIDLSDPTDNDIDVAQTLPAIFGGSDSFSFSFWIQYNDPTTIPTSQNYATILECSTNNTGSSSARGDNLISFNVYNDLSYRLNTSTKLINAASESVLATPANMFKVSTTGIWHHVSIVYDAQSEQTLIYVNSAVAASSSWIGSILTNRPPRAIRQCFIGKSRTAGVARISMKLASLQFYSGVALRPEQVWNMYKHPPTRLANVKNGIGALSNSTIDRLLSSSLSTFSWLTGPSPSSLPGRMPTLSVGGGILTFDGSNTGQFISLLDPADNLNTNSRPLSKSALSNVRTNGLTLSFWLQFHSTLPKDNTHVLEWFSTPVNTQPGGSTLPSSKMTLETSQAQWLVRMSYNGTDTCVVKFNSYTIAVDAISHHYVFVFSPEGSISLYVDGLLRPPSELNVCNTTALGNTALFSPISYMSSDATLFTTTATFGGGPGVNGVSTYGMTAKLVMINVWTRELMKSEISLLSRTNPSPSSVVISPQGSVQPNSLASASYSWRFQSSLTSKTFPSSSIPLLAAPSGVGTIGRMKYASMDLKENVLGPGMATVNGGANPFVFSTWIFLNSFWYDPTGNATSYDPVLLDMHSSASMNSARILFTLHTASNATVGYRVGLYVSNIAGTQIYNIQTQLGVVRPNEWINLAFVIANGKAKIYSNAALLMTTPGAAALDYTTRDTLQFAYNSQMGSLPAQSLLDMQIAQLDIWDNSGVILPTTQFMLDLYRTPPASLLGTLGTSVDRLKKSAAGRYECWPFALTSSGTSSVIVVNGATSDLDLAMCRFDDIQWSALDLDNPTEMPTGQIMPLGFHTDPSLIGEQTHGFTLSIHFTLASYPTGGAYMTLFSCSKPGAPTTSKLHIHISSDVALGLTLQYSTTDPGGNSLSGAKIFLKSDQLPLHQPIHLVITHETDLASGMTSLVPYINGVSIGFNGINNPQPIPSAPRACYFGRDTLPLAGKAATNQNFLGDLSTLLFYTRVLSAQEIQTLATHIPPAFANQGTLVVAATTRLDGGTSDALLELTSSIQLTCAARVPQQTNVVLHTRNEYSWLLDSYSQTCDSIVWRNMSATQDILTCAPPPALLTGDDFIVAQVYTTSSTDPTSVNPLQFTNSRTATYMQPQAFITSLSLEQGNSRFGPIQPIVLNEKVFLRSLFTYTTQPLPIWCQSVSIFFNIPPAQTVSFIMNTQAAIDVDENVYFISFPIVTGVNTLKMTTIQGVYTLTFINPPPPITALSISSTTPASSALQFSPPHQVFDTDFVTPFGSYVYHVTKYVTSITFNIVISSGATVSVTKNPATVPITPLVSANTQFTVPLTKNTPCNITFLVSPGYELYQITIVPDLISQLFITSLAVTTTNVQGTTSQTLSPSLSTSQSIYTFTTVQTFVSIKLAFSIIPGDSVTFNINGGASQILTYPSSSITFNLVVGATNRINIISAQEGAYRIDYYCPPYAVVSVTVQSLQFDTPPAIPLPPLLLQPAFDPTGLTFNFLSFQTTVGLTLNITTRQAGVAVSVYGVQTQPCVIGQNSITVKPVAPISIVYINTPSGNYVIFFSIYASPNVALPFTALSVSESDSGLPVAFTAPLSLSTTFAYTVITPPRASLIAYLISVTCTANPCVSRVTLNGGASAPISTGTNTIDLGILPVGQTTVKLTAPYTSPYYQNYSLFFDIPPPQPCLSITCSNNATCLNQRNSNYNTSYTCYCSALYQGPLCEKVIENPYQPTYPTAVIAASSSSVTDCMDLTLDGSNSYGLGPVSLNPFYTWSLTSIRISGSEVLNINDPLYNPNLAVSLFQANPGSLSSSTIFPATSVIKIQVGLMITNASYTFSLKVGNQYETSSLASTTVSKLPLSSVAWTPSLGLKVPSKVTRQDVVVLQAVMTPSACQAIPVDAIAVWMWNVTMVSKVAGAAAALPDVSVIPLTARLLNGTSSNTFSIQSNFFRTGYQYSLLLDLTLSTPAAPLPRRLLAASEVAHITATSTLILSSSIITARIIGGDRSKPVDAPFTIAADESTDPDYVNDNAGVNAPTYAGLSFLWSCKLVTNGTSCILPSNLDLTQVRVDVPADVMSIGTVYQWTVTATSIIDSTRSASTSVHVSGIDSTFVKTPAVTILNSPVRMNTEDTLRLSATVVTQTNTPVISMLFTWSIASISSLTPVGTLPSLYDSSNLGSAVNSSSLVLLENLLLIPGTYQFTVVVTDPFTIANALTQTYASASTSVNVIVNARPQAGECTITPATDGVALVTVFALSCTNWYEPLNANFAPFTYALSYRDTSSSTTSYQQLTSASLSSQKSFLLPSGTLSLRTEVRDQIGALAYYDLSVTVNQPSNNTQFDLLAYIANLTYVQLPSVMNTGDSVSTVSFIHQIADLINTARGMDQYLDATSQATLLTYNLDLIPSHQLALTTTLQSSQTSLSTSTLTVLTQSLVPLTKYARTFPDGVVVNLTQEVTDTLKSAFLSKQLDPTAAVKDLTTVTSNLLTACSQLDVISGLVHESMRLRQIHAVAGESIKLPAVNYYAYVERTLVAAGTEVHLPTGESVILTPTAMKNYILRLNQLNISTIDTGGAVGAAEMDTRIVTFSSRWSSCRATSNVALSDLTNIEITFPNGDLVDIASLDTDIQFTIPISKNSTDSIIAQARANLPCPEAPFDPLTIANTSFTCQFWNVTSKSYSSQGCHSEGVTFLPDGSTLLKCACSHLTEFAILYAEAQDLYSNDVCVNTESTLGNILYLVFLIIYSLVGFFALVQVIRLWTLHGTRKFVLITVEHTLILSMCIFRAVNMSMYYTLYKEISISKQIIISSLPYLFYSWIFTLIIVMWASIWSTSSRGEKNDNPLKPYRVQFMIGNMFITIAFLIIFGLMSQTTNLEDLRVLNRAGVALMCLVEMGFGLFLVVYGLLLVRALTEHFVSAYAKKLGAIAIGFSLAFGVSACILAYSVAEEDSFQKHALTYNAIIFSLDIVGLLLVMYLFAKSISKASGSGEKSGSRGTDGSTNGSSNGSRGGKSHNPLSSRSGVSASGGGGGGNGGSRSEVVQLSHVQSPISRAMSTASSPASPSGTNRPAPPPPSTRKHQAPSFVRGSDVSGPNTSPPSATSSPPPLPRPSSPSDSITPPQSATESEQHQRQQSHPPPPPLPRDSAAIDVHDAPPHTAAIVDEDGAILVQNPMYAHSSQQSASYAQPIETQSIEVQSLNENDF